LHPHNSGQLEEVYACERKRERESEREIERGKERRMDGGREGGRTRPSRTIEGGRQNKT
jgi:hypothetical protein